MPLGTVMELTGAPDGVSDTARPTSEDAPVARSAERRRGFAVEKQVRSLVPLVAVWAVGAVVFWWLISRNHIADEELLLDASYLAGRPWYSGLISSLGVLAWTFATVVAGAGAFIAHVGRRESATRFLVQASVLSAILTLDDLFQLHTSVFTRAFDVTKSVVVLSYLALTILWAIRNVHEIRRTRWLLLVVAGASFAASVFFDRSGTGLLAEDAPKFFGVLAWALYFALTAGDIARSVVKTAGIVHLEQESVPSA